jgi:hypothetical protein
MDDEPTFACAAGGESGLPERRAARELLAAPRAVAAALRDAEARAPRRPRPARGRPPA